MSKNIVGPDLELDIAIGSNVYDVDPEEEEDSEDTISVPEEVEEELTKVFSQADHKVSDEGQTINELGPGEGKLIQGSVIDSLRFE
jgi:hypothetical protein